MHVIESPCVRFLFADWMGDASGVINVPSVVQEFALIPSEAEFILTSGSAGIFPLSLGRERVFSHIGFCLDVEFGDELLTIVPANPFDGF